MNILPLGLCMGAVGLVACSQGRFKSLTLSTSGAFPLTVVAEILLRESLRVRNRFCDTVFEVEERMKFGRVGGRRTKLEREDCDRSPAFHWWL